MALKWDPNTDTWTEVPDAPDPNQGNPNPFTPTELRRSQMTPEELAAADEKRRQAAIPITGEGAPPATTQGNAQRSAETTGLDSGNRGGVIGAIGDAGNAVINAFDDTFSQDPVVAPAIDESKFQRQPDSAATQGYLQQGQTARGDTLTLLNNDLAKAAQQRAAGTKAATQGAQVAAGQRAQGDAALQAEQARAGGLQANAADAANRGGPAALSDADRARNLQFEALTNPGPSAAQTQLQMGSDAAMGQALALARSGRNGTNPAAERQAMFQNAATMQNLSGQQSLLRAQEEQQRIAGLGNVGSQALGAANAQTQAQAASDQTALGYESAANQAAALGYNAAQGFGGVANQTQGNAQQYDIGLQNAANTREGQGKQTYIAGAGLEQQYSELAEKARAGDRDAQIALERLKAEQAMAASAANAEYDQKRDSGLLGMAASAVGAFLSDERSKQRIKELEGELARTYKALGGPPATQGVRKGGDASPALAKRDQDLSRDLDAAMAPTYAALSGAPATAGTDLRGAKGYSYEYKNPNQPGAAPGTQYGPMAQDLEKSPATAASVMDTPNGKMVDAGRLTMTNTAAIGEQQRKADEQQARIADLEKQVQAMGGDPNDKYASADFNNAKKEEDRGQGLRDWGSRAMAGGF